MNPMSLPRATLFTIGALVVALVGWGALIYTTASHNGAKKQWTDERTALDKRVAELTRTGEGLETQISDLETKLAEQRKVAGDLAALRGKIDQANAKLSDRMTVLGERERQIAAAEADLGGLQEQLQQAQAGIDRAKGMVNQRMAVLGEREGDIATLRGQRARLDSDTAAAEARLSAIRDRLNQRMAVLGERERDLQAQRRAEANAAAQLAADEDRLAEVRDRLNKRMGVLREREHEAAELAYAVMQTDGRLARVQETAAGAEAKLVDRQTALGAAEIRLADAERSLSHRNAEMARTTARLGEAEAQLAKLEGQVDHALLAKEAGELGARRDALTQEVAALDQEIERKGPLAQSAVTLNTRVGELEDQLLRLTREREQAAAAVRDTQRELELVKADRDLAGREHARLLAQVNELGERKADTEAKLASLNADVQHQDSVFATLEVLKKEQGFLRELIGGMLDDGSATRDRIRDLHQESEALLAQQLQLEKDLIGKQTEIQMLDKAIVAKSRSLESDESNVKNARTF